MSTSQPPSWYQSGDLPATLRAAFEEADATTSTVVDVLVEHELNAPRQRVEDLVESSRGQLPDNPESGSDSIEPLDDPRSTQVRYVDSSDLTYLGRRDRTLVLGSMLSRWDGRFRIPEEIDSLDIDLLWNRPRTTVGLRTPVAEGDVHIDEDCVTAVANGQTAPSSGRSPSIIGVVSIMGFTEAANEAAAEHDIKLFGQNHIERLCAAARFTHGVLGDIVEDDATTYEDVEESLTQLPSLPPVVDNCDPLDMMANNTWPDVEPSPVGSVKADPSNESGTTETESPTLGGGSSDEAPDEARELGTLYADPEEDGDSDAFGRYEEALKEDN